MKKILWLIAARSGSKSIQDKNIKKLGNLPLLAYRIKSALSISNSSDVWISTDCENYARIAKEYGASVPFIRPQELATDTASSSDVVLHAMDFAESKGLKYDALGLLEPTSPFITYYQLKNAFKLLIEENEAENIVACRETRPNSFFIQNDTKYLKILAERLEKLKFQGRQNFTKEITPSGGFYISKWEAFKRNKTFYTSKTLSFLVGIENELEIDELIDWKFAEFILENKIININDIYKA